MTSKPDLNTDDRIVLAHVQQNARTPLDALAQAAGLSAPSVQRRLRRLRASGVIRAEVALVDPATAGRPMTFIVLVELERERANIVDAFRRRMDAEPQVQQCHYITGEADFALICLARDMDDDEALTRCLFFKDAAVCRFRTSVAM